jgi:hypothetical protein
VLLIALPFPSNTALETLGICAKSMELLYVRRVRAGTMQKAPWLGLREFLLGRGSLYHFYTNMPHWA